MDLVRRATRERTEGMANEQRKCTAFTHEWVSRPGVDPMSGLCDVCSNCGAGRFEEARVYQIEQAAELLRIRYEECAQCHASLSEPPPGCAPHCDDCTVDESHLEEWDETVGN